MCPLDPHRCPTLLCALKNLPSPSQAPSQPPGCDIPDAALTGSCDLTGPSCPLPTVLRALGVPSALQPTHTSRPSVQAGPRLSRQACLLPVHVAHETRALLRAGYICLPGTGLRPCPWAEATGGHHPPHQQSPWWITTKSEVTHSRHTVLGVTLSPPQPSPTSALPTALGSRMSTWQLLFDLEPSSAPALQAMSSSGDVASLPHGQ